MIHSQEAHFLTHQGRNETISEGLERLQQQKIIVPLGFDKTTEWCYSFFIVLKPNGTVYLCLDPEQLNQTLIRPIHRGPIINDIFLKLTDM